MESTATNRFSQEQQLVNCSRELTTLLSTYSEQFNAIEQKRAEEWQSAQRNYAEQEEKLHATLQARTAEFQKQLADIQSTSEERANYINRYKAYIEKVEQRFASNVEQYRQNLKATYQEEQQALQTIVNEKQKSVEYYQSHPQHPDLVPASKVRWHARKWMADKVNTSKGVRVWNWILNIYILLFLADMLHALIVWSLNPLPNALYFAIFNLDTFIGIGILLLLLLIFYIYGYTQQKRGVSQQNARLEEEHKAATENAQQALTKAQDALSRWNKEHAFLFDAQGTWLPISSIKVSKTQADTLLQSTLKELRNSRPTTYGSQWEYKFIINYNGNNSI